MMFHLRSNVLVLVLLAAALQQASSSSSVVIAEYSRGDGEVLLAEEEDESSSSSSVDTLDEFQLAAMKESYRDESLPTVSSNMWHNVGVTSSSCCNKSLSFAFSHLTRPHRPMSLEHW
jgi:hypothetical protein